MAVDPFIIPRPQSDSWQKWIRETTAQFLRPLEAWRRSENPFPQYAFPAFFSVDNAQVPTAFADIPADGTWQPLANVLTQRRVDPLRADYDPTTDQYQFEISQTYAFMFNGLLSHNRFNGVRRIGIRAFNVTQNAAGTSFALSISESVEDTVIALVGLTVTGTPGDIGRLEIGGNNSGQPITDVIFQDLEFSVFAIGPRGVPVGSGGASRTLPPQLL